jgi:hypothetical protein
LAIPFVEDINLPDLNRYQNEAIQALGEDDDEGFVDDERIAGVREEHFNDDAEENNDPYGNLPQLHMTSPLCPLDNNQLIEFKTNVPELIQIAHGEIGQNYTDCINLFCYGMDVLRTLLHA